MWWFNIGSLYVFTSRNLDTVRTDLEKAIAAVEAKHGITLGLGKISCERDGSTFHLKLSGNIGTPEEAAKLQWDKWCEIFL